MKIKTLGAFQTRVHRVISKKAGLIINMPKEDYEEVKDLCEVLDKPKIKKDKENKSWQT